MTEGDGGGGVGAGVATKRTMVLVLGLVLTRSGCFGLHTRLGSDFFPADNESDNDSWQRRNKEAKHVKEHVRTFLRQTKN